MEWVCCGKKSLDATEISDIQSDRICGIRVKKSSVDDTSITILGVYLPCLDLGIDLFRDCLAELERVISESECMGPVIVTGDFNAHLGSMWGPRAGGNPNLQGVLLGDLLNRCKLHAVSLSESVSGPSYTYKSGNTVTTVDYILADIEASSCIDSCKVCSDDDLNTSDHLALSVTLSCHIPTQFTSDPNWNRIDWTEAAKSQALQAFQKEVAIRLKPFTGQAQGNVDHIDNEIKHVAWLILDAAQKTLPQLKPKKTKRFKDRTLSQLCTKSKEAWNVWCTNGKPSNGPLYEVKCAMRREVRKRIKLCTAMEERRQIQKREHLFRKNSHLRFQRPRKRGKSRCTRLRVNDVLLSEPAQLLEAWSTHFRTLAESQINSEPGLKEMQRQQVSLLSCTFQMEETFLDTSFTEIEVAHAVQRMKLRKSAGPDDLVAEHLHYGGRSVIIWLTEILNSILDVEEIPCSLKTGLTIPVYKGGGKDPCDVNSYRGITLNSVLSKALELLILQRLEPLFTDAGIPHPNQSAYRRNVSCADAIFATQEVINRYLREGSRVYMCLYDLQKAFDSIEFPVLLKSLFDAGVNSKTWRILNSWYTDCQTSVRLGRHTSPLFSLGRGVRQGSVLSPSLFLLVMDPLLRELQSLSVGTSVNGMYAGGFLHADDIRTLATSPSSLETQVSIVSNFTKGNFLKLNTSKCEIIVFGKSAAMPQSKGPEVGIPVKEEVKCLGNKWKGNLSSSSAITERIQKSRRAFFEFGSVFAF